ncbi:MAG: hypothetical protein AAGD25_32950 [Cyanobacteria bacterium P01_F01_bin.150]
MSFDRLNQLEELLSNLYEQKYALEEEADLTPDPLARTQAEQRIRKRILPQIKKYETEKWELLAAQADSLDIDEDDAEVAIAEIIEAAPRIEAQSGSYPDEVLILLQQIVAKLEEPGPTAAGKLKGVLSSFPPFIGVSYEAELDTENVARKYFPTFSKLIPKSLKGQSND